MKIVKILFAIIFPLFLLAGCAEPTTPQIAYEIGVEHTFETIKVKLEHDEAQERFILYYNILEQETTTHFFAFTLHVSPSEFLTNSDQLAYTDNLGSKIEFDQDGYFTFYTSRIFYISYQNASDDIKNLIADKNCSIELPIGTFTFV